MKARRGIILAVCLLAGRMLAQQSGQLRDYPVPNHGSLRLSVPDSWKVDGSAMPDPATMFLHITPAKGKSFDVQVTVIWLNPANLARTTPESIQANTERTGNSVLLQSVEKNLTLLELRGTQSIGTYYSLTDRRPAPGEFKHLTQGSFLTGELLSAFTIHSDNSGSSEIRQLLRIFSEATYVSAGGAVATPKP